MASLIPLSGSVKFGWMAMEMEVHAYVFSNDSHKIKKADRNLLRTYTRSEFEWTTDSPNNSFVEDGKLFLVPTLTVCFHNSFLTSREKRNFDCKFRRTLSVKKPCSLAG